MLASDFADAVWQLNEARQVIGRYQRIMRNYHERESGAVLARSRTRQAARLVEA